MVVDHRRLLIDHRPSWPSGQRTVMSWLSLQMRSQGVGSLGSFACARGAIQLDAGGEWSPVASLALCVLFG